MCPWLRLTPLAALLLLACGGGKAEGESDLEGLALDGERLWLVGSHSLRRRQQVSHKVHLP